MQPEDHPRLAQQLLLVGEALVVTLGATAPLSLWTASTRKWPSAVVGVAAAAGLVGSVAWKRELAARPNGRRNKVKPVRKARR